VATAHAPERAGTASGDELIDAREVGRHRNDEGQIFPADAVPMGHVDVHTICHAGPDPWPAAAHPNVVVIGSSNRRPVGRRLRRKRSPLRAVPFPQAAVQLPLHEVHGGDGPHRRESAETLVDPFESGIQTRLPRSHCIPSPRRLPERRVGGIVERRRAHPPRCALAHPSEYRVRRAVMCAGSIGDRIDLSVPTTARGSTSSLKRQHHDDRRATSRPREPLGGRATAVEKYQLQRIARGQRHEKWKLIYPDLIRRLRIPAPTPAGPFRSRCR
jgi:hypothetical protein